MQVTDKFYVYLWRDQRENNCNSVVIDGKVPLLIDPGHERFVPELLDRMRADGFHPDKIKVVIVTHSHPDHLESIVRFSGPDVRIGLSREEEKYIEDVGRPMYLQHGLQMPEFSIDFNLQEGDLTIGKHQFEVLLTPGHSPGGICIYWPKHKTLIAGDVVFKQGVGRADLPGGNGDHLKKSIERLSKLPIELLIPGHGPAIQGAENVKANFDIIKKIYFSML